MQELIDSISETQNNLYDKLNCFSSTDKTAGRIIAIPVGISDVVLDTLKTPLCAINNIYLIAINLIGSAFYQRFSLKRALKNTELALQNISAIPVKLAMAPIKLIFQIFTGIINPTQVSSIKNFNYNV